MNKISTMTMNHIKNTFRYFLRSEINQWQLFTDLVSILSIFAGILYIGGYMYLESYYEKFFINLNVINWDVTFCITAFISLLITKAKFASFSIAIAFALLFHFARNISKPFLGYILLIIILIGIFYKATSFAIMSGKDNAGRDWNTSTSLLPIAEIIMEELPIFGNPVIDNGFRDFKFRLLYENDINIYLIETRKENDKSDLPIFIIPKSKVKAISIVRTGI